MASLLLCALADLKLCFTRLYSQESQRVSNRSKRLTATALGKAWVRKWQSARLVLTLGLFVLLALWGLGNGSVKSLACDDMCQPNDSPQTQPIKDALTRGAAKPDRRANHTLKNPLVISARPQQTTKRQGYEHALPDALDLYGLVVKIEPLPQNSARPATSQLLSTDEDEPVQLVTVRLSGNLKHLGLKSDLVQVKHVLVKNPAYRIPLKPGTRVLLNAERKPGTEQWTFYIANRDRTPALMILGALTVMAVLLIGGPSVAKHVFLSLIVLCGCYNALFPAIRQYETGPLWIFLICAMYTILGTFIYQRPGTKQFSREQCVVILGTLGGLSILTTILWIMHEITPLDGYTSENLAALWYEWPRMDYWSFYLGSVILGFQGFIFYLCWSLAQNRSQEEVLTFWTRFQVVMMRGRNMLGPLLSSLSLLFIGLLMPILLQLDGTPTAQFVNLESTAAILTFAFSGGLTLLITVPLTALLAAWQLNRTSHSPSETSTNPAA